MLWYTRGCNSCTIIMNYNDTVVTRKKLYVFIFSWKTTHATSTPTAGWIIPNTMDEGKKNGKIKSAAYVFY